MTDKNVRKQVDILGIKVDSTSKKRVLREIQSRLSQKGKFYIVTPNPEQVLIAQKDLQYLNILNSADISVPDGVGLIAASKFFSLPRPGNIIERALVLFTQGLGVGFSILFDRNWLESELKLIKGREIFIELIKLANKKSWKVILLGDKMQSAQKAAKKLSQNFINLNVIGITGPDLSNDGRYKAKEDRVYEERAINKINMIKPDLLFIGFRAPVQERWLYQWYKRLDFRCAMVVGGTFDYVSGKKPVPPKWIDDLNLEWLWRLYKGDQKIERVYKAFPEFPLKVFSQKLTQNP